MYCVYLTTYKGNSLPPFYIGYSTIKKVNNGYHGSVSSKEYKQIWEYELKQNPEKFRTYIIYSNEDKENVMLKELKLQKHLKVHINPLYSNKALGGSHLYFCNLRGENNPFYGKKHTKETRQIIKTKRKNQILSQKQLETLRENNRKMDRNIIIQASKKYWAKPSSRQKVSERMSFERHHNAKSFLFVEPSGTEHIIVGKFKHFCREHGLSSERMENHIDKGPIPNAPKKIQTSINCNGWQVSRLFGPS